MSPVTSYSRWAGWLLSQTALRVAATLPLQQCGRVSSGLGCDFRPVRNFAGLPLNVRALIFATFGVVAALRCIFRRPDIKRAITLRQQYTAFGSVPCWLAIAERSCARLRESARGSDPVDM
jgi:hypothetical protein